MDAFYKQDIIDIELTTGNIKRSFLMRTIGFQDNQADRFGVRVFRDGAPLNIEGSSIHGFFKNAQGVNIALTECGTVSGNEAYITLPQACYQVEGQFTLALKLIGGGVTGTMRIIDGVVDNTNTGGSVTPGTPIPSYQEILALYEQMLQAKEGSVRFDILQEDSKTEANKEQARGNAGVHSNIDVGLTSNGRYLFNSGDFVSGYWSYSSKSQSNSRIRTKSLIPVTKGMYIRYTNPTLKLYFGVLATTSSNTYLQTTGWINAGIGGTVTINNDGYLTFIAEGAGSIQPGDYDCIVELFTGMQTSITNTNSILKNNGIDVWQYGYFDTTSNVTFYDDPNKNRILIDWNYYGKTLYIKCNQGYTVYAVNSSFQVTTISERESYLYAYPGSMWAFVIRRTDNGFIAFDEAAANITITEAVNDTEPHGNGLIKENVKLIPNASFNTETCKYVQLEDKAISAPILIPKGGMRIVPTRTKANGEERIKPLGFRTIFVKETNSGFVLCTEEDDADFAAENLSEIHTYEPVYIPYREGIYAIIRIGYYGDYPEQGEEEEEQEDRGNPENLIDGIHIFSGEFTGHGKLLGMNPVRVYVRDGAPVIRWGSQDAIVNTTNYFGGFMWLKYVKSITVNPKYSIIANVYKLLNDGTTELMDSYWTSETGEDAARVAGVNFIDFSKYDFNGFIHFAIESSVEYRARGAEVVSYKTLTGMGVMSKYLDVYNNVFVEYKNGYQITIEPGMPSIIFDNINAYMEYMYPLRQQSYYVNPNDIGSSKHLFTQTENATPAFYAGFNGNTVFQNVTGKSYYTSMANRNSRAYNFARDDTSRANIGYGITCSNFVDILNGLEENLFTTDYAFADLLKFKRIKPDRPYDPNDPYKWFDPENPDAGHDYWDYTEDMDLLKPGDCMAEKIPTPSGEAGDFTTGHCMMVYEKKYINGQLEAIIIIEAGYPYTRFTTLYNDKYFPITGSWQSFRRLADYHFVSRIRPQYLRKITDVFDLSTNYTVGTIMNERGYDSLYCINPIDGAFPDRNFELADQKLILTITDDNATEVRIYRNGELSRTINIGSEVMNNLRIVDIRQYITDDGLYTLKTNTSEDVQDRFYVQKPMFYETDGGDAPEGYVRIHIPSRVTLKYMQVSYEIPHESGGIIQMDTSWRKTYIANQFSEDTPQPGLPYDSSWGVIDVPDVFYIPEEFGNNGVATYSHINLIYGTDYGTFQMRYLKRNGTYTPCAFSGYVLNE